MIFKKLTVKAVSVLLVSSILPAAHLNAEYVFKKDGAIIKGSITGDDIGFISVKNNSGVIEKVPRNEILRIIYTDLYLGKVYVRLTTGEMVEGYQVDEDRDDFFFRRDISKPEEFKIRRKKVMFIARTNPTDLEGKASTEKIKLTWSPPFKPAKFYRIYLRDLKGKEETFRIAEEIKDLSCELINLKKSWIYEIYATAVSETGEESLPSEKVVINTLPEAPDKLVINEKYSKDGKTVTLTLTWKNVTDSESRVKSYNVYKSEGKERVIKGSSQGSEFIIKDFPAEGRHWFSVAAVNDIFTESEEIKAVYDAGYKIYLRTSADYIYPFGTMSELAAYGYGATISTGFYGKNFGAGFESGYYTFSREEEIEAMTMIPLLLEFNYRIDIFQTFTVRPSLKTGFSYNIMKYTEHEKTDPLVTSTADSSGFDPLASAHVTLDWMAGERFTITGGAGYGLIFQKKERMNYAVMSLGAAFIF